MQKNLILPPSPGLAPLGADTNHAAPAPLTGWGQCQFRPTPRHYWRHNAVAARPATDPLDHRKISPPATARAQHFSLLCDCLSCITVRALMCGCAQQCRAQKFRILCTARSNICALHRCNFISRSLIAQHAHQILHLPEGVGPNHQLPIPGWLGGSILITSAPLHPVDRCKTGR